jgi:tetratricopeptide (TPR) repeat protein
MYEACSELERHEEARAHLAASLELLTALEAEHGDALQVARKLGYTLMRCGDEERAQGRLEEALAAYEDAGARLMDAAARDPQHAWTRRMVLMQRRWRGLALQELAEASAGAERAEHYRSAIEVLEAALAERDALEPEGFLEPRDTEIAADMRARLEACRAALAAATAP